MNQGIELLRDGDDTLRLHGDLPFTDAEVFIGTHPDAIDSPVAGVDGQSEISISGLDPATRYYVAVQGGDGRRITAGERRLPLEGALNFRDLGGYFTESGQQVRWGLLYRSDALDRLKSEDLRYVDALNLQTICDLRSQVECNNRPSKLTAPQHLHMPIKDDMVNGEQIISQLKTGDATGLDTEMMIGSYRRLLDGFPQTFGRVLRHLSQPENQPGLFHCTAGKDRTGLTAAMLLSLLGVPRDVIMHDYTLTNTFVKPFTDMLQSRLEAVGVDFEQVRAIFSAPSVLLESAFDHLDTYYGGVEAYLRDHAGLDDTTIQALRTRLLT